MDRGAVIGAILHVEDESAVRLLYKEVFEEQGHEMLQVTTAEEVLATVRSVHHGRKRLQHRIKRPNLTA